MNEPKARQIVITMSPAGEVNISAPLADKLFCYGMLEVARQMVQDFKPEERSRIAAAPAHLGPLVRAKGG